MLSIPTLDVPMQLLVVMQVIQTHQQLPHDDGDVVLRDQAGAQQIAATPAGAELHDDPEIGSLEIRAMVLGDVGRAEFGQDGDLEDDVLNLVLGVLDIDDLDGDRFACSLVDAGLESDGINIAGWSSY